MKKLYSSLLALLLIIGFFIRVWDLTSVPPGLYWDEMDVGYQAYSILKTGRDYYGNHPLLTIHSFADFRAPLLIYTIIPFVALFDLTAFSVRFPAAILGTISILLVFILTEELFKDKKVALIAAGLTAFAPWNIQYSRISFEVILMLPLFLGGLICFFKGLAKPKWFIPGAVLFSLNLFTYNTVKLFVPLVVFSLMIIYFRKLPLRRDLLIALTIFSVSFIASLYSTVFLNGGQRFAEISIFTDPQTASQVNFLRNQSETAYDIKTIPGEEPRFLDKVIYNKVNFMLDRISQNYLQVFSSEFLFIRGDPNLRHSASAVGEFYRIEALTILFGLTFILFNLKKDRKYAFLLVWIGIAPLSAVVTREGGNHASRLFLLFPALTITSALGIKYIWQILPGRINLGSISLIVVLWIFSMVSFLNFYFGAYKLESARAFQYGFDQAVSRALENKNSYEYVIIDDKKDSALMNYLFLSKYDPVKFQSEVKDIHTHFFDYEADKLGNVIFMKPQQRDWENIFRFKLVDNNYLLIISSEQLNEETPEKVFKKLTRNQKLLEIIRYKSGTPAFYVISSHKPGQI